MRTLVLGFPAQAVAAQISQAPLLYQLAPVEAPRSSTTSSHHCQPNVEELWVTVAAEVGNVRVRKPAGATAAWRVILYIYGGGWFLRNACIHDRPDSIERGRLARTSAAISVVSPC